MHRRLLAATTTLAVLAAGTAALAAPDPEPETDRPLTFLHVATVGGDRQIVDAHGRSVLLRGVNVDGLVDYWRPDLRTPYPIAPTAYDDGRCPADDPTVEGVPVCWFDLPQMRALGYDDIRLNVSWSLLEPKPGRIDPTYVERIAQVVGWAREQGIWVTIDMHQDAWSKYVFTSSGGECPPPLGATRGYDGAPAWASAHRLPACTLGGTRELDPAVAEAAQAFWSDLPAPDGVGLQEHYTAAVTALARRFADDPTVTGYDLMNEPEPGLAPEAESSGELMPFYAKVTAGVLAAVPRFRQLVFLEPGVERDITAQRAYVLPWSAYSAYPNAVYAPHDYTGVFTLGAQTGAPVDSFQADYDAAAADAVALGLPLWIGEFGGPPSTDRTVLAGHYAQQEARRIGSSMWLWKENANDTVGNSFWGVYGPPFDGATPTGVPQPDRIRRTSRVYPLVTFGSLQRAVSDPYAGTADVVAVAPHRVRPGDDAHATVVSVPAVFTGRLAVQGAAWRVVPRDGGRDVWLYPTSGRYELTVTP